MIGAIANKRLFCYNLTFLWTSNNIRTDKFNQTLLKHTPRSSITQYLAIIVNDVKVKVVVILFLYGTPPDPADFGRIFMIEVGECYNGILNLERSAERTHVKEAIDDRG